MVLATCTPHQRTSLPRICGHHQTLAFLPCIFPLQVKIVSESVRAPPKTPKTTRAARLPGKMAMQMPSSSRFVWAARSEASRMEANVASPADRPRRMLRVVRLQYGVQELDHASIDQRKRQVFHSQEPRIPRIRSLTCWVLWVPKCLRVRPLQWRV